METMIDLEISPNDASWIKYKDRLGWNDIEPLPQNDGDHPVTQIAYTDVFSDVFDYFRAVLQRNELSERAFQLSKDAAILNPANYTVWHFRRVLIKALNKDLQEELKWIAHIIEEHPKNYQVWHHRQVIVQWSGNATQEKEFSKSILEMDAKNYHAWQYRLSILQEFDLWDGELEFVNRLLEEDVRNNSAWNQRFIVLTQTGQLKKEETILEEVKFTMEKIRMVPNNESSWNYLRGILQDQGLSSCSPVITFCEQIYTDGCRSPHLLCFMVDYLQELGSTSRAIQICNNLAKDHDTIRKEYWNFLARTISEEQSKDQ